MIGRRPGESPAAGNATVDGIGALRRLETMGVTDPWLLGYWPVDRVNPFQDLIYRRAWAHGIAPIPLGSLEEADALAGLGGLGGRVALHLHWTASVLTGVANEAAATSAATAFEARLDRLVAAGARLVWTVHNVLPHDTPYPSVETRIRQAMADRAHVVHALSPETEVAAAGTFTLVPERVMHVPHPSDVGAYPDRITRDQARQALGLDHDATVFLLIGAIRPYKGLDALLQAWDRVSAADPRRRLVVAGPARRDAATVRFLEACLVHPTIDLHAGRIPSDDMATYLRAADVAVLPYRQTLNSGVLLLALTFGLRVVAVEAAGIRHLTGPDVARTFSADDPSSLAEAMIAIEALPAAGVALAAARIVADLHPDLIAERFALELRRRLTSEAGEGPPR